mgnify:CR=1 FL=1
MNLQHIFDFCWPLVYGFRANDAVDFKRSARTAPEKAFANRQAIFSTRRQAGYFLAWQKAGRTAFHSAPFPPR